MATKQTERKKGEIALPFDSTQEIDPAFADLLQKGAEPTLTQCEFDELAVTPPKASTPRR